MLDRERLDPVPVARDRVTRLELDRLERVGEPPEDPPEGRDQVAKPGRAVDRQRKLAPTERVRLQHPRKAEVVIGVEVGQEHLAQLDEPHVAAEELALSALGAVEEQALAPATDERRSRRALGRRRGAGRPEEDDVEIHGGGLYVPPQKTPQLRR